MAMKPYTNTGKTVLHIGGKMIRPGETREVDASLLGPAKSKPVAVASAPAPLADAIADLLKKPIKELVPMLPSLTGEQLDALEAGEQADERPRSTLLKEITEERLRRAAAEDQTNAEMQVWIELLTGMSDDELMEQVAAFGDDEGRLLLIQEEIDRRHLARQGGAA